MKQPNILLVMSDQLIPMMTGAFGHPVARTPNIDAFMERAVNFTNAYSPAPICGPARMAFLTGKYVSRIGCYDNASVLHADEPTHNHYFSAAGYDTVLSGKVHAVGPDQLHGFEKRLMTNVYPANFHWLAKRKEGVDFKDLHPQPIAIDYIGEHVGPRQWSMELDYDEEVLFQARRYLASKCSRPSGTAQKPLPKRDERPFFLEVSFNHPHEPFHNLNKFWEMYEDADIPIPEYPENLEETWSLMDRELIGFHGSQLVDLKNPGSLKRLHRAYLASLSYFDAKFGELLQSLDDFGLSDNTVVILSSDHGDMLGHRGMVQKRTFYENSARIIMGIAGCRAYPIEAGVCSDPVSLVDLTPTMLEIAGITDYLPMDGRSLLPQLRGEREMNRYVFCEHHAEGVTNTNFMIRKGDYKYIYMNAGDEQLFNLKDDPGEWQNLSEDPEHRSVRDELKELLLSRFNPDRIDRETEESVRKRWVIKRAHETVRVPSWNYRPVLNIDHMFWRSEEE